MADDNTLLWLAGLAVVGVVGAIAGFILAGQGAGRAEPSSVDWLSEYEAPEEPRVMQNHEEIEYTDRRGRRQVILINRTVE